MSRKRAASPSLIEDFDDEFCENSCSSGKYSMKIKGLLSIKFIKKLQEITVQRKMKMKRKVCEILRKFYCSILMKVQKDSHCPCNGTPLMPGKELECVFYPVHFVVLKRNCHGSRLILNYRNWIHWDWPPFIFNNYARASRLEKIYITQQMKFHASIQIHQQAKIKRVWWVTRFQFSVFN